MGLFSKVGSLIDTTLSYIWKGFISLLLFALALGVFVIYGILSLGEIALNAAKRGWKRVKEKFPGAKLRAIDVVGGNKLIDAINIIKQDATISNDPITMRELEDIEDGAQEADAASILEGIDANGNEAILDIEFLKADGINRNEVYTTSITR
ncbi:MAG: hypothetical protein SOT07_09305 [Paludibacteraceae bacterium]|nr:hypothetical protein [Paludibacteraceae bacterium]